MKSQDHRMCNVELKELTNILALGSSVTIMLLSQGLPISAYNICISAR